MDSIKPFFNERGWTDVEPFELVSVISDKTVEVRAMKCTEDKTGWTPNYVRGGFSGICTNQHDQKWIIEQDETAPIVRLRKHKNGQWKDKYGARYGNSDAPHKFYDFNF